MPEQQNDSQNSGSPREAGMPPAGSSISFQSPPGGAVAGSPAAPAAPTVPSVTPDSNIITPAQMANRLSVSAEDIRTMPSPVGSPSGSKPTAPVSGKKIVIIIGIIAVVMGGLTAGAYFYLNSDLNPFVPKAPPPDTNVPTAPVATTNTNQATSTTPAIDAAASARDQQRIADVTTIARALEDYKTRFSSYPQFMSQIPADIASSLPVDPKTQKSYAYNATADRQSYLLVFDVESGVTFKNRSLTPGSWDVSPSDFNETAGTTNTNPGDASQLANLDADGDGLTAAEEKLFKTSPVASDTDADGYKDAVEIQNLFSPINSGAITLEAAGLVSHYTHATLGYSLYYPSIWAVSIPSGNQQQALVTSDTGEDFTIEVFDNTDHLTSWDWYTKKVSSDFNKNNVTFVTIAGHEAVKTKDGLTVYLATKDHMYVFTYDLNGVSTVNYPNVFNLLLTRVTLPAE